MPSGEIYVVTGSGQGHLHPCMELCKLLISRDFHTTLVAFSNLSSDIPSAFTSHPLVSLQLISGFSGTPMMQSDADQQKSRQDLFDQLTARSNNHDSPKMLCAIIDFQLGWTKEVFWKFDVPVIGFFTFSACAAAMEWGAWKADAYNLRPSESRLIPGLPESMAISYCDLKRKPMGPPGSQRGGPKPGAIKGGGGPPVPGRRPPWVSAIEGSVALMFNTRADLERPFLEYMEAQMGIPAWAIGPLLPEQYWNASTGLVRDGETRHQTRQSNYTEEEIIQWLESKPRRSVLYVAFGSEVGPTADENLELASALEESMRPFIWVLQTKSRGEFSPEALDSKVGDRGLIINGWAPQLLILSHSSTSGFLSHCGWNSTVEALGRGVPFLAWPHRGDQYYNAKLLVDHLRVGYRVSDDLSVKLRKEEIVKGIERLMGDEEIHERAAEIRVGLGDRFPATSMSAIDTFGAFIRSTKEET